MEMRCTICGKVSDEKRICKSCDYFLKHGADEETIKRMLSDDKTQKIWNENEKIAEELADAYYGSLLDAYGNAQIRKFSKEDHGYNTFLDGIRLGLDISMPMLDKETQDKIKAKVRDMLMVRKNAKKDMPH